MKFKEEDRVIVKGLDIPFVVVGYLADNLVKLRIEGESLEGIHSVVHARPEVLLLNNKENCSAEGWI